MSILLSPETQKLLDVQLRRTGTMDADQLIRAALTAYEVEGDAVVDASVLDAYDRAEHDRLAGRLIPWAEVRASLLKAR